MSVDQKQPIRVAHVIGKLNYAGVEAVINNYYRNIDHTKYQFDFIIDADGSSEPSREIIDLGARYIVVPPYQQFGHHMNALIRLFRENQYQIVHSSMNALSVFSLCAAAIAKVPVRICHNHSTSAPGEGKRTLIKNTLRPFAKIFPTHLCACSQVAGEWLYGKRTMEKGQVTIFNNAIDTKKYAFNPEIRKAVRAEFGFDQDTFVIGHVGRFCYQKNQEYLLDVFAEVHRNYPKSVLMMVGIGETQDKIRGIIHSLGLDEFVMITGARSDADRLYQAMDVFVLPSRYEGLPVVGVEAQCAGLPCFFSDQITNETLIIPEAQMLSPNDLPCNWAQEILKAKDKTRRNTVHEIAQAGFEITSAAKKLEKYYDNCLFS